MTHDFLGVLKICGAVLFSAVFAGMIVGFFDGGESGRRAFRVVLLIAGTIGALQVATAAFVPWVLGVSASIFVIGFYLLRKERR
jgi:hypothetical protein